MIRRLKGNRHFRTWSLSDDHFTAECQEHWLFCEQGKDRRYDHADVYWVSIRAQDLYPVVTMYVEDSDPDRARARAFNSMMEQLGR